MDSQNLEALGVDDLPKDVAVQGLRRLEEAVAE